MVLSPNCWPNYTFVQELQDPEENSHTLVPLLPKFKVANVYLKSQILPFDVFALTETSLDDTLLSNQYLIFDFSVFRKGLSFQFPCLGVLVARNTYKYWLFDTHNTDGIEIIYVKITLKHKIVYILNCYLRPNSPIETYQSLVNAIDYLTSYIIVFDNIVICGNFNLPKLNWVPSDNQRV